MEERIKKQARCAKYVDAMPLSWDMAAKSKRMLTDRQVVQLYLPAATRGALSMGRFGKGPYAALPYRKLGRACRYVESAVVRFVEELAGG
jgi:hypothetical protein